MTDRISLLIVTIWQMIIYFDEISVHLSMTIELYDKPRVREIRNDGNDGVGSSGSSKKGKESPSIIDHKEPLSP